MTRLLLTIAFVLVLLALATPARAQQTQSLAWDYIGTTPAEVAAGSQTVQFNGVTIATAPACVAKTTAPTGTTCTVPLPLPMLPTNTASVSLIKAGVTATTSIAGITTAASASASNPRLTINVTINLGS